MAVFQTKFGFMLAERPARDGGAGAKEELNSRAMDGMQTAKRRCHKFQHGTVPNKVYFMLAERPARGRSCASCARGINASMHVIAGLGPKKNSASAPGMACTQPRKTVISFSMAPSQTKSSFARTGTKEKLSIRARDSMQTTEKHCHKFQHGAHPSLQQAYTNTKTPGKTGLFTFQGDCW
ncbi:MAG: hypothetical protein QGG02_14755 [Gammaproteobacteria bacterium]|nr:hypothetical protein [Gammaproteobacteria bacterium]MDP6733803.1 hypothetical protein [Gammaproteobacteria bacterium]